MEREKKTNLSFYKNVSLNAMNLLPMRITSLKLVFFFFWYHLKETIQVNP